MTQIAVLLGAGASKDAELPTTAELTNEIARHLKARRGSQETLRILNFVTGELLAEEGRRGNDVFGGIDVERVMTAIELLGIRQDLEISPFVHSWNPQVEHSDSVTPPISPMVIREIRQGITSRLSSDLERPLRRFVESVAGPSRRRDAGRAFRNAFQVLRTSVVEVLASPADTAYLHPIVDLVNRQGETTVATLNYDRTLELEAISSGVLLSTGIEHWADTGKWHWGDGIRLLKLHGSVDWTEVRADRGDTMRQYRVITGDVPAHVPRQPAVIFGGRNKLRAEGPFLELLAQFEAQLDEARCLLIVGYSFRDDHVNEVVRRWVNKRDNTRIVVVDPNFVDEYSMGRWSHDPSFSRQLLTALTQRPEQAEIPARPGYPGQAAQPSSPARLRVYRESARMALSNALETAWGIEPWATTTPIVTG